MAKIVTIQTKGGAGKSTTAIQVLGAYFLSKGEDVKNFEYDDENHDSKDFSSSKIVSSQELVGDSTTELASSITDKIMDDGNTVFDVGGNKTTTMFLDALEESRMHMGIDLFVIPMSSGAKDLDNAIKTYDRVKEYGKPVLFVLGRTRSQTGSQRIYFQYRNFFTKLPDVDYIQVEESDAVDLSRDLKRTVLEVSQNTKLKDGFEKQLVEAFKKKDRAALAYAQETVKVFDDSKILVERCLSKAWDKMDEILNKDTPKKDK